MTTPLYPNLAPLTFSWGFLQTNIHHAKGSLHSWLLKTFPRCEMTDLEVPLEDALRRLQPLTIPPSKMLLVPTQSDWIACFDNGANGADLLSVMSVLTHRLKCTGLILRCAIDKRMYSPKDTQDHFTRLGLEIFKAESEPLTGPTRFVSPSQYYGTWKVNQGGEPLAGENVVQYKVSPIKARLTLDTLDATCQSLGLLPFLPSFYRNYSCLIALEEVTNYPVRRSLSEAQEIYWPHVDRA